MKMLGIFSLSRWPVVSLVSLGSGPLALDLPRVHRCDRCSIALGLVHYATVNEFCRKVATVKDFDTNDCISRYQTFGERRLFDRARLQRRDTKSKQPQRVAAVASSAHYMRCCGNWAALLMIIAVGVVIVVRSSARLLRFVVSQSPRAAFRLCRVLLSCIVLRSHKYDLVACLTHAARCVGGHGPLLPRAVGASERSQSDVARRVSAERVCRARD